VGRSGVLSVFNEILRLPRAVLGFAVTLVGMVAFLSWDQSHWWRLREDYFFGFFVPIFVGYVLLERWPAIRDHFCGAAAPASPARGERWLGPVLGFVAGAAVLGGIVFLLGGAAMRAIEGPRLPASQMHAIGFAAFLLGGVYLIGGRDAEGRQQPVRARWGLALLFVFPALIWMLSAPMVDFLERQVSLILLNRVASVVFWVFDVLGYTLIRQGNVLQLPTGDVGVEDACSGIRSLTGCLFAGSFLAAVFLDRFWKKVLMVGMAMLFAFLMNILRSLFLTAWAYQNGADSISGTVHDATGYAVLGLTLVGLIALLPIFNYRLEWEDEPGEGGDDDSSAPVAPPAV